MTIIPFRTADRVAADQMADTEAASSIPPWPVDFGPRQSSADAEDTRPGAGAGCLIWPAVSVAAVVACVFVAHWLAH